MIKLIYYSDSIFVAKFMIFCTQLTFDLILRLTNIFRLGIHPYELCHMLRHNISIGRIMYSILPSTLKISDCFRLELPTTWSLKHLFILIQTLFQSCCHAAYFTSSSCRTAMLLTLRSSFCHAVMRLTLPIHAAVRPCC